LARRGAAKATKALKYSLAFSNRFLRLASKQIRPVSKQIRLADLQQVRSHFERHDLIRSVKTLSSHRTIQSAQRLHALRQRRRVEMRTALIQAVADAKTVSQKSDTSFPASMVIRLPGKMDS